ncbi:hypothetical protein EBS02_01320 [bacterium]|nr:hypothetical protein [bacterium]
MVETRPFSEKQITDNSYERFFSASVDSSELHWHIDLEDRLIRALEKNDWLIQLDNDLPRKIENEELFIPQGKWHRLIRGTSDLRISLKKLNQTPLSSEIES